MDPKDAEYHFKRCVDSGLWVENASDAQGDQGEEEEGTTSAEKPAEPEAESKPAAEASPSV